MISQEQIEQFFGGINGQSSKKPIFINKKGEAIPGCTGIILDWDTKLMSGAGYESNSRSLLVLIDGVKSSALELGKLEKAKHLIKTGSPLGLIVPKMCVTADKMIRALVTTDETPRILKDYDIVQMQMKEGSESLILGSFAIFKNIRDENSNEKQTEEDVTLKKGKVPSKTYYLKCADFEIIDPPSLTPNDLKIINKVPHCHSFQFDTMTLNWNRHLKMAIDIIQKTKTYEMIENGGFVTWFTPGQNVVYECQQGGLMLGIASMIDYDRDFYQEPGYPSVIITSLQLSEIDKDTQVVTKSPTLGLKITMNERGTWTSLSEDDVEITKEMGRRSIITTNIPPYIDTPMKGKVPQTTGYSGFYNVLKITDEEDHEIFTPWVHPDLIGHGHVGSTQTPAPKNQSGVSFMEQSAVLGSSFSRSHIFGGMYQWLQNYAMKVDHTFISFEYMHMLNDLYVMCEYKKATKSSTPDIVMGKLWYTNPFAEPKTDIRVTYLSKCARNPLNINQDSTLFNWKETDILAKEMARSCENGFIWGSRNQPDSQVVESLLQLKILRGKTAIEIMRMSHPNMITNPGVTYFWTRLFIRIIHYALMANHVNDALPLKANLIMSAYSKMMDDAVNADARKFIKDDDFKWDTNASKEDWTNFAKNSAFLAYGYQIQTTIEQRIVARDANKKEKESRESEESPEKKKKVDAQIPKEASKEFESEPKDDEQMNE